MRRAYCNWSGGKDAALALYRTLRQGRVEVCALLAGIQADSNQVLLHHTPVWLLQRQAERIGLPLTLLPYTGLAGQDQAALGRVLGAWRDAGINTAIFGDLYRQDIRQYRQERLAETGMQGEFPLWGTSPADLLLEFCALGFRAVVTCVDGSVLDRDYVGREIDASFLRDLPPCVDPCGENGEYHSFVYDGPMFKTPVPFALGKIRRLDFPPGDDGKGGVFWTCGIAPSQTEA